MKRGEANEVITRYGQIIADECHHLSAFSFEQVLKKAKARYVLGLTATPIRKDGHHPIIFMQCGPVRHHVSTKAHLDKDKTQYKVTVRQTLFVSPATDKAFMPELYRALVEAEYRNQQILKDVLDALKQNRKLLLLTERTQHLAWFQKALQAATIAHIYTLKGGMGKKEQAQILKTLAGIPEDTGRIILATGRYIGEGFDDPMLDTLFLALPISWQGTLQQYVGRLHRMHAHKKEVLVYDYVDSQVPALLKMYQKRFKKYRSMGYEVEEHTN